MQGRLAPVRVTRQPLRSNTTPFSRSASRRLADYGTNGVPHPPCMDQVTA
ncbi:MAG: hypothetical protein MZV70_63460 [Desulfobacterales bacterium]|nr:hypothetical protein [Desulfobacterales bacterium]